MKRVRAVVVVLTGVVISSCESQPSWPADYLPRDAVAKVHGKLRDQKGAPIAGQWFECSAISYKQERLYTWNGFTNQQGEYVFEVNGEQTVTFEEVDRAPHWYPVDFRLQTGNASIFIEASFRVTAKEVELPDIRQWSAAVVQTEREDGTLDVRLADVPEIKGLLPQYKMLSWEIPDRYFRWKQASISLSPWEREDFELYIQPSISWQSSTTPFIRVEQSPIENQTIFLKRGSKVAATRGATCISDLSKPGTCPFTDGSLKSPYPAYNDEGSYNVITFSLANPINLSRLLLSGLRIAKAVKGNTQFIIETSLDGHSWKPVHAKEVPNQGSELSVFFDDALIGDGLVLNEIELVSQIRLRVDTDVTGLTQEIPRFLGLLEFSAFEAQ